MRPDNPVVVIVGDTQRTSRLELWWRANDAEQRALLAEVARRRPAAVLNVGDLVTWGPSAAQWRHFDRAHAPLAAAGVPVLPVLGNHDYLPWPPRALAPYTARFPHVADARWFVLRHAGVAFVALDSNFG
ncbi:MAG: metallophosphatase family protein, partial [Deltaproteobacteria bacterium]